ncbi:ion channel [Thiomicrorhabdus indica]|uniref:ion channel n=1 Tax=Thiomicrorhabdus indica TaxID=2267253 RepID=UPI002AA6A3E0|nr:ion channel [Thiomicrorhabdus indica]
MNIRAVLGVAGVSPFENKQARQIGQFFEYLVLAALLAVFVQLILSYTEFSYESEWLNHLVWAVFALEFIVNLTMVNNRVRYFQQNWLNFAIVILAFPWIEWSSEWAIIIRTLRLLLLMRFFVNFFQDVVKLLRKNRFGQILVGFAFLVVGAGGVFVYIEDRPFIDGIWYAVVTITTVGYGDVVPQTENGRIFGTILIVFGVLFFSLVTANFSAFLIGSEQRKLEKEILGYVQNTEKRLTKLSTENERHVEYIMLHMSNELVQLKEELNDLRQKEIQRLRAELESRTSHFSESTTEKSSEQNESELATDKPIPAPSFSGNGFSSMKSGFESDAQKNLKSQEQHRKNETEFEAKQDSESGQADEKGDQTDEPTTEKGFHRFGFLHKRPKKD